MLKLPIEPSELVTFEDGFVYFWPEVNRGGLSSNNLREIADHLDEVNREWSLQVDEYFELHKVETLEINLKSAMEFQ